MLFIRGMHPSWTRLLIITGIALTLGLCCISNVFTSQRPVNCDGLAYYRVNYIQCDDASDGYAPWFWFFHENYYTYVNDDMDHPLYHPVGWYTSPLFYRTRYYRSGNGSNRIDNYQVGNSSARQRFGGGGRGSGGSNGRFGGGGRGGFHGKP